MYEENLETLGPGDAATVFADVLADISVGPVEAVTPDSVVRWALPEIRPPVARVCRRLLLPGSGVVGLDHLQTLIQKVRDGSSCLICFNHHGNLDVPTLYVLMKDQARLDWFDRIIWISGRKLEEDLGLTPILVRGFNRVIVTPKSWIDQGRSVSELQQARQINIAAHRAIHDLRHQGWIFGLFPCGTRIRPDRPSTAIAVEETDSYLKNFDHMLLANIEGCTLPVARDHDFTHETPALARVVYTFGPVVKTDEWRAAAANRFTELPAREASVKAMTQDLRSVT